VNAGRVIGRVTATRRVAELGAARLVLLQPVDQDDRDQGDPIVASDPLVGAGVGCVVWYVNGSDAADAFDHRQPVDAAIVGMFDA
jgi:ethanolamine utilization protein EutN